MKTTSKPPLHPDDPVETLGLSDSLILPLLRLRVYTIGDLARLPQWRLARQSCAVPLAAQLVTLRQRAHAALGGLPKAPREVPWQQALPHLPGRVRLLLRGFDSVGAVHDAFVAGCIGRGRLRGWERAAMGESLALAGWPVPPPAPSASSAKRPRAPRPEVQASATVVPRAAMVRKALLETVVPTSAERSGLDLALLPRLHAGTVAASPEVASFASLPARAPATSVKRPATPPASSGLEAERALPTTRTSLSPSLAVVERVPAPIEVQVPAPPSGGAVGARVVKFTLAPAPLASAKDAPKGRIVGARKSRVWRRALTPIRRAGRRTMGLKPAPQPRNGSTAQALPTLFDRLGSRGLDLRGRWQEHLPPMPLRVRRTLLERGILTIGDAATAIDQGQLLRLRNFGARSLLRLRMGLERLADRGLAPLPQRIGALVQELLASVDYREREVLQRRYLHHESHRGIARGVHLSRERVRQVLAEAVAQWRPRYAALARSLVAPLLQPLRDGALIDRMTAARLLGEEDLSIGQVALALALCEPVPGLLVWRRCYLTTLAHPGDREALRRVRLALRSQKRRRLSLRRAVPLVCEALRLDLTCETVVTVLRRGLCLVIDEDGMIQVGPPRPLSDAAATAPAAASPGLDETSAR